MSIMNGKSLFISENMNKYVTIESSSSKFFEFMNERNVEIYNDLILSKERKYELFVSSSSKTSFKMKYKDFEDMGVLYEMSDNVKSLIDAIQREDVFNEDFTILEIDDIRDDIAEVDITTFSFSNERKYYFWKDKYININHDYYKIHYNLIR